MISMQTQYALESAAGDVVSVLFNSAWITWTIWLLLMIADYTSGTVAAWFTGEWSSETAREGIKHKVGEMFIIAVVVCIDIVIRTAQYNGAIRVPFAYNGFLTNLVLIFYIITESLSIIENAVKMGAPVPPFVLHALKAAQNVIEKKGDTVADEIIANNPERDDNRKDDM